MASSNADCVRGLARLISSTRTNCENSGPKLNSARPVFGSRCGSPRTSAGCRSGVHWIRLKVQPALCANARASIVLATPGTSSINRCPSASQTAVASTTCSCLPTMTFSTLATSCCAMGETSAGASFFAASIGSRVTFGFFSIGGEGRSMPLEFQKFAKGATDFFQVMRLFRSVFVRAHRADADGADDFVAVTQRHAERTADAGLPRAGPGHAAGIGLQITESNRPAARNDLPGNAFADRNGFHDLKHWRRQAGLGDELQQLFPGIEPVNRAGFGPEMFEDFAQGFLQNRLALATAFQEQADLFDEWVHTITCESGPDIYSNRRRRSMAESRVSVGGANHLAGGTRFRPTGRARRKSQW